MLRNRYDYKFNDEFVIYTFESVGPRGVIKKIVSYTYMETRPDGRHIYNLGFGDWNPEENTIDDSTNSNNHDRDKVLETVAATILQFTSIYGNVAVAARGATPARTRLYQMGLNAHREDVEALFTVYGLLDDEWIEFKPGQNFEAFLVVKK